MNATHPQPESSDRNYQQALSAYLERGGEALLARAYDFGREALAQGRSIPDLVGLHSRALRALVAAADRSEEHTSELQSQSNLVCRLLLEKKKKQYLALAQLVVIRWQACGR